MIFLTFDQGQNHLWVASELELSVISLSSTAEGYGERINTMKDDISQLERWDGDDRDFEDSQDVIQMLRRYIPKV